MQAYDECLKTMYGLRRFGIKLGLDVITQILEGLDSPQNTYRTIHVAGTNGKGSVASMLAGILQTAGFRVGLYTSPHLIHFNERIRIDGRPVTDPEIVASYRAIRDVQEGDREPTFFEFTTAMALHLFKEHQVEWAVIETGIRSLLTHPGSAWFSNLFAGTNREGVTLVCGYVNALGSDGEDTGRQPFYGTLWMRGPRPVFEIYGFGGNVVRRRSIVHKCRRRGLPL